MREDLSHLPCHRPELSSSLLFQEPEAAVPPGRLEEASPLPDAGFPNTDLDRDRYAENLKEYSWDPLQGMREAGLGIGRK